MSGGKGGRNLGRAVEMFTGERTFVCSRVGLNVSNGWDRSESGQRQDLQVQEAFIAQQPVSMSSSVGK